MKSFKITAAIALSLLFTNFKPVEQPKMFKRLGKYLASLEGEFGQIPEERKEKLKELGDYIYEKNKDGKSARLTVICTHNSRRSHMAQLWLWAAAAYYGIDGVATYSGGTEATAFNPRAVAALKRAGFKLHRSAGGKNPSYQASYGPGFSSVIMFSKRFDDRNNPAKGFAAVMVCSDADAACPVVPGSDDRFSVPFEDPKNFDGTPYEQNAYDERCRQIARDMLFAVRHTKQRMVEDREKTITPHPKD